MEVKVKGALIKFFSRTSKLFLVALLVVCVTPVFAAGFAISGTVTVTGTTTPLSGVTVALTGATTKTATTDIYGKYTLSGLSTGTYTVTPTKTGYHFTAQSWSATISAGKTVNFSGAPVVISGTVKNGTGAAMANVSMTLAGATKTTVLTNSSGAYKFTKVADGSYTVTPSMSGYYFYPAADSQPPAINNYSSVGIHVTISNTNSSTGNDFKSEKAPCITGAVVYSGTKTGRIYLSVQSTGGNTGVGTSITSKGAYKICGLPPSGAGYSVRAWMDTQANGQPNVIDPYGSNSVDPTTWSADVTLADPPSVEPSEPGSVHVFPMNKAAAIVWDSVYNNITDLGGSRATAYKIYWGQGSDCSAVTYSSAKFKANDSGVYFKAGLTNGSQYCFKVSSLVGTMESTVTAPIGPITIGNPAGGVTVSGAVTFGGTATGPLWVVLHNDSAGLVFGTRIATPAASPANYTISGVQPGTYKVFVFIDMNNNGIVDAGDKVAIEDLTIPVTVGGSNLTGQNLTIPNGNSLPIVPTEHKCVFSGGSCAPGTDGYTLTPRIYPLVKLPVKVRLLSGPNVVAPIDIAYDGNSDRFDFWADLAATAPATGDKYTFSVTYSDGTTETLSKTVTAVLGGADMAVPVSPIGPSDSTTPDFSWSAPATPPQPYTYEVGVLDLATFGTIWQYPNGNDSVLLPPTTSVQFNIDGNANQPALDSAAPYAWWITVRDSHLNKGTYYAAFVTPGSIISGTVTLTGTGLSGVTMTLSSGQTVVATTQTGADGSYSFTDVPNGNYTITASMSGYTFDSLNPIAAVNNSDSPGHDFTATAAATYTITGTVKLSGTGVQNIAVTLSANGTPIQQATTDGSGNYSFDGVPDGSYTVTPSSGVWSFSPSNIPVTISGAGSSPNDFAVNTYNISGTVTGPSGPLSGVTVTLGGGGWAQVTTDGSGQYSISNYPNGNYTVTPGLSGYTFNPVSRSLTLSNADSTGNDFTGTTQPTYAIRGTVTGPNGPLAGVTMTLSGDASSTTPTDGSGSYSFSGLSNGSYTVTPSMDGDTFNPANHPVTINNSDSSGNNFSATFIGYSISGNISYGGSRSGWIYVTVMWSGCSGCKTGLGTAVQLPNGSSTVAYTIRGLQPGSYTVQAWMDAAGSGSPSVVDPNGTGAGTINVSSSNISGQDITLSDPTPPATATPQNLNVVPQSNAAVIIWDAVRYNVGGMNIEGATAYTIYWGTGSDCSTVTYSSSATVPSGQNNVFFQSGVTNGTQYCYKISSWIDGTESAPSAAVGPITIAAPTGGHTISGQVTFSGAATGPLWIAVHGKTGIYGTTIANPTSPQSFAINGVQDGIYKTFALVDMNDNGTIDAGDKPGTDDFMPILTMSGADVTKNLTIPAGNALATVPTMHQHNFLNGSYNAGSNNYTLMPHIFPLTKVPVKATITAGPNALVPFDIGFDTDWGNVDTWIGLGSTAPTVGDTYTFDVTYSDNSTETLQASVTAVLTTANMATPASPTWIGDMPTLYWTAPSNPPASYTYELGVMDATNGYWIWQYPNGGDKILTSSTTSVPFNKDGSASQSPLISGTQYDWWITVKDSNLNEGQNYSTFTAP